MAVPQTIDVHEAQLRLPELVALVLTGTDIILTDGATAVVRLVPVPITAGPRVAGLHTGAMTLAADFDEPLPEAWWAGTP